MKKFLNILILSCVLLLSSCAENEEKMNNDTGGTTCMPLEGIFDLKQNDKYKLITIPDDSSGVVVQKGIMEWVTDRVTDVITDATSKIYEEIAGDDEFKEIIGLMIALTIMFYAMSIMLGISQASGYAALMLFLKIIIVYNLAMHWELFNTYVVEVFEAFVYDSVQFAGDTFHKYKGWEKLYGTPPPGAPTGTSLFAEIDKMLSVFWDFRMAKVIMAFMLTGITGFFWGLMLLMFLLLYLSAVIMAVKTYLFALLARHVLYALGPIFLSFALFNQTKSLFDGYIEQLINFSLQPVFLFIFLGLFHSVLAGFASEMYLKNLTDPDNYTDTSGGAIEGAKPCIEYKAMEGFNLGGRPLHWYKLCFQKGDEKRCPEGDDENPTIPIDIWVLISAIIVCYLMYSMTSWVVVVATRLSSGYVNISDIPIEGFGKLQSAAKGGISKVFSGGSGSRTGIN